MSNIRVMVVDDEPSFRYTMKEVLSSHGYFVEDAVDAFDALSKFDIFKPHIVITDYSMPRMNGLELLTKLRERSAEVIIIVMTAYGTEDIAVKAMKAGAWDYFGKPLDNDEMLLRLAAASLEVEALVSEQGDSEDGAPEHKSRPAAEGAENDEPEMLFASKSMDAVYQVICQVAGTDVTVLVQGESGTGKEMIASAVHGKSKRNSKPFIKLNCAALPEQLIESELFGYEAGAFTGAKGRRKGKFEQANGGTIFLDEIGDMTLPTQTKVLRVLQEREIERLGGSGSIKVDVRVIAATHQNLEKKIQTGEFREDLFYRLNVVRIALPPLREREGDIELLANHFLKIYTKQFSKDLVELSDQVLSKMCRHQWPGNVRELENAIARAVVLDSFEHIVPQMTGQQMAVPVSSSYAELLSMNHKDAKQKLLADFEQIYLRHQLDKAEGNVSKAARMSGMHRKNFWEKLQRYEQTEGLDDGDSGDLEDGDE